MSDQMPTEPDSTPPVIDIRNVVRAAIEEFVQAQQHKAEPAYKTELHDERKRREGLETRVNQLVDENRRARTIAEEADKNSQIRSELQRLGVAKLDLAFKAVRDDIVRVEDGQLQAKGPGNKSLEDYLTGFVQENPELLPARIAGGSGAQGSSRNATPGSSSGFDLDKIKPGMNKDELERVRQEISQLAAKALRGTY